LSAESAEAAKGDAELALAGGLSADDGVEAEERGRGEGGGFQEEAAGNWK
jgi:hypothetical protein